MRIAILGSGPSGLFAAHAAVQSGIDDLVIFDRQPDIARKTSGVFYIHDSCDLLLERHIINQGVLGAVGQSENTIAEKYGRKVYGKPIAKVSIIDALNRKSIYGYNSKQAMDRLWDLYKDNIEIRSFENYDEVHNLLREGFDKVISTIPAPSLFPKLTFNFEKAWMRVGTAPLSESFIFYSISSVHKWYRASALFGAFVQEFPERIPKKEKEGYQIFDITKVINGDRLPQHPDILFAGRFGAWDKTQLTHTVYFKTLEWLKGTIENG